VAEEEVLNFDPDTVVEADVPPLQQDKVAM